ncbi:MAG TPA: cytosine permease [Mycobacteriales bacterium]|jgi:NCS1 family nucleobase:cation symporter-1|nr:cytosine permease [Mycobacteriales bacterium]
MAVTVPAEAVREGTYGDRVVAVEPGGVGFIPLEERHGRPRQLLWTWASPNLEFATVFVGVLAVAAFGLGFWVALAAIVLGTGLGAVSHGVLSARGPAHGVPQMVLSRLGFGYWGNVLPAGLNAITAGIGWFAVNSVSGALALNTLTDLPKVVCLIVIVAVQLGVAFFGHNLVQAFERYAFPILAVIFLIAAITIFAKTTPSAGAGGGSGSLGGFLLTVGATFGYAAGWNPYAADYTRYFRADVSKRAVGWCAGLGVFVSCVLLETVGAGAATLVDPGAALGDPTGSFTGNLPSVTANLTLLAIALGAVSANALNVYSGAMSFVALGVNLPLAARRAISALGFGLIGFVVALTGLDDAGAKYESFLLVIAYWIGPWLGVMFVDQALRRGQPLAQFLYDKRYANWAGPIAMLSGMLISILLFSNQTRFVGYVARQSSSFGDIAFEVGFLVAAGVYYALAANKVRART